MNWFRTENNSQYRNSLLSAFPKSMKSDVEAVINILPMDVKDVKLKDGLIHTVDNLIHTKFLNVRQNNEELTIPYRLYFNEPLLQNENELTELQKTILSCIFLRHHDGHLRQRRLEKIIDKRDYWIIPFTFQLLGEYVVEILPILNKHINDATLDDYRRFCIENSKYCQLTENRMISYWNAYYRYSFPKLKDYPGRQIFDRIKKRTHNMG